MGNLHRIQWIDEKIRAKSFPNCNHIVSHFEISKRQALRDIEYLRYSLGAPIEYSSKYSGYYYKDEGYMLPSTMISNDEKRTLNNLAENYKSIGNERANEIAKLLSKLSSGVENYGKFKKDILVFPKIQDMGVYNTIKQAMDLSVKTYIEYNDSKNRITKRVICPYKVFSKNNENYVVGMCERRKNIRVFNIDRILNAKKLYESFEIIETFESEKYSGNRPFIIKNEYIAKVQFENNIDKFHYNGSKRNLTEDVYEFGFLRSDIFLAFLLSMNISFKILAPSWLKERLVSHLNKIMENNQ